MRIFSWLRGNVKETPKSNVKCDCAFCASRESNPIEYAVTISSFTPAPILRKIENKDPGETERVREYLEEGDFKIFQGLANKLYKTRARERLLRGEILTKIKRILDKYGERVYTIWGREREHATYKGCEYIRVFHLYNSIKDEKIRQTYLTIPLFIAAKIALITIPFEEKLRLINRVCGIPNSEAIRLIKQAAEKG